MPLPLAQRDSSYDDLPYGSHWRATLDASVLAAHPDRAHWADVAGVSPRAVCDLACGSGRQVLLGALQHADVRFVGVDGSTSHINEANALREVLGLTNVTFVCADLMDWTPEAAHYDLMTCSGTFPWVPDVVRDRILQIFDLGLSANGLAVLHILSLPASLGVVEAQRRLLDAVGTSGSITERLLAAKAYVASLPPPDDADQSSVNAIARSLLRQVVDRNDPGVAHEFLGAPVRADYFRDFEASVNQHGLHLVGDASPTAMCDRQIPQGPLRELYERTQSWPARQELLDMFAGVGGGRDAVLSRRARAAPGAGPNALRPNVLYARSTGNFDRPSRDAHQLVWHRDAEITVTAAQAALWNRVLAAAPECVPVESNERDDADFLCIHGYLELSTRPTTGAALHGAAPTTVSLARAEVEANLGELTGVLGYRLPSVPAVALVLALADGSRDTAELAVACEAQWAASANLPGANTDAASVAAAWAQWWSLPRKGEPSSVPSMDTINFSQLIDRLARLGYFC